MFTQMITIPSAKEILIRKTLLQTSLQYEAESLDNSSILTIKNE